MIKKAKKKPIEIEYVKWDGKNQREMFDFLTNNEKENQRPTLEENTFRIDLCNGTCQVGNLIIKTKEGEMKADIGDCIIKEPFSTDDRKFYPCKPDIFEKTYEEVKLIEQNKNEWTIGQLEEFIKEYPKDTKVVIQSIISGEEYYCSDTEDVYYSEDSESHDKLLVFVPKEIEIIRDEE
jgi:hypothetical protein